MSKIRNKALASLDVRKEMVTMPEWDRVVLEMRGLGVATLGKLIRAAKDEQGEHDETRFALSVVIASAHDPEDGSKVFSEGDIELLGEKSAATISKMSTVAIRLSGMDEAAVEGNSVPMPIGSDSSE